jgi:hypothetical protein
VLCAVGTLLLLDVECEAFRSLVKPSQISQLNKKRKRVGVTYDCAGIPVIPETESMGVVAGEDSKRFIQVKHVYYHRSSDNFRINTMPSYWCSPESEVFTSSWDVCQSLKNFSISECCSGDMAHISTL